MGLAGFRYFEYRFKGFDSLSDSLFWIFALMLVLRKEGDMMIKVMKMPLSITCWDDGDVETTMVCSWLLQKVSSDPW